MDYGGRARARTHYLMDDNCDTYISVLVDLPDSILDLPPKTDPTNELGLGFSGGKSGAGRQ